MTRMTNASVAGSALLLYIVMPRGCDAPSKPSAYNHPDTLVIDDWR